MHVGFFVNVQVNSGFPGTRRTLWIRPRLCELLAYSLCQCFSAFSLEWNYLGGLPCLRNLVQWHMGSIPNGHFSIYVFLHEKHLLIQMYVSITSYC